MVSCKLYGRLGNQLFQIAATLGYAYKHNDMYGIPRTTVNPAVYPAYFADRDGFGVLGGEPMNYPYETWKEPSHAYTEIPFAKHRLLDGYFQSEKYFVPFREKILKDLGFYYAFAKGTVGIHIRRGDFLLYPDKHPVVSLTYLFKAITYFIDQGFFDFIVYTDDPKWCKENLQPNKLGVVSTTEVNIWLPESLSAKDDLVALSCHEHQIISNSSFGWWGAWLNQNPDKIIIAPDPWFGPGNAHLDTKDLLPKGWIKLRR